MSKRNEKVLSATKNTPAAKQDVVVENSPKYKVEVVENQNEASKPYGFHVESDVSVVFKAKLPKDRVAVPVEKRPVEPDTTPVESTKKETLPTLELKLDLESESESEPEQSVGKVEPIQMKREEPEIENHVSTSDDASETEPEADTEPEIVPSDENVDQEVPTDNGNVELVISDVEPEPEVKIETKDPEEASPPVAVTQSKPEFLQTPSDVEVIDGSPLALTVKVKGTLIPPLPTFHFFKM